MKPRWLTAGLILLATGVTGACLLFLWARSSKRNAHYSAVGSALFQIKYNAEEFFAENPDLIFAQFEDVISPKGYLRDQPQTGGEDYHEVFPIRVDFAALAVTTNDGQRLVRLWADAPARAGSGFLVRLAPNGKLHALIGGSDAIALYEHLFRSQPDGVQSNRLSDGRRLETTYRNSTPDGPFHAFYADGKPWADATYHTGRLSGRHVIYGRDGKIVYETTFPP